VLVEIAPIDVLSLLPHPLAKDIAQESDPRAPSVLHDERGASRVRRVSWSCEWDEAASRRRSNAPPTRYDKSSSSILPVRRAARRPRRHQRAKSRDFDASTPRAQAADGRASGRRRAAEGDG
jgi:hypothetical protein